MLPYITAECIDTFDPKIIRVTFHISDRPEDAYSLDFSSDDYNKVFGTFGFPPNPCG